MDNADQSFSAEQIVAWIESAKKGDEASADNLLLAFAKHISNAIERAIEFCKSFQTQAHRRYFFVCACEWVKSKISRYKLKPCDFGEWISKTVYWLVRRHIAPHIASQAGKHSQTNANYKKVKDAIEELQFQGNLNPSCSEIAACIKKYHDESEGGDLSKQTIKNAKIKHDYDHGTSPHLYNDEQDDHTPDKMAEATELSNFLNQTAKEHLTEIQQFTCARRFWGGDAYDKIGEALREKFHMEFESDKEMTNYVTNTLKAIFKKMREDPLLKEFAECYGMEAILKKKPKNNSTRKEPKSNL